jgi:hypothetical protein
VAVLAEAAELLLDRSLEEATDIVWTLCSLAVHDHLVLERGWSADRYRAGLADALTRELLADADAPSGRPPD